MKKKNNQRGFTLTELIIVIGIISVLVLLIVAYFRSQILKGNDARRKAEVRRIGIAAEEYEKDHNCYPLPSLVVCGGSGLLPYLDKIPCDPVTNASYYYDHEDSVCPSWYHIYVDLENTSDTDYIYGLGPGGAFSYEYSSPNSPDSQVTNATPPPGGGGGGSIPGDDFYGCFSGACTMISWDPLRPGPECDPNFQNPTCYGQCTNPSNECKYWD